MELSILVARIVSLTYVAVAIGALSSTAHYNKVFSDLEKSPALTYLAGFLALIAGMIIVQYHNYWVWDWTVFVTLIGWCALVKGVTLIAFPGLLDRFKPLFNHPKYFGVLALLMGLLFGFFGFFL